LKGEILPFVEKKVDVVILGAGISGCSAAQELQANGIQYLLLEKNVEPGGLTRSISLGDAHFDYTGHYLHLKRCKYPADIPYAEQNNEDWQLIERKSVVYVNSNIVPAPLQYNLFALPPDIRRDCIDSYRKRKSIECPKSLNDYLLSGFGKAVCDIFLFPYNEKQMAVSLNSLSVETVSRFFPYPDEKMIEEGYAKSQECEPSGYNRCFWYPKYEGIGLLAKGLAKGLKNLRTCCNVQKIDFINKRIYTSQGKIGYNKLISSIPLKYMCAIGNNVDLNIFGVKLRHNRVLCLNLLCDVPFHRDFEQCHWIYVPNKSIPFYRVGFYSHFDCSYIPSGKTAMYIETALSDKEPIPELNTLIGKLLTAMEQLNWMRRKDCSVISANWINCGYVHFDHYRKETVGQILNILNSIDVYPIGRYGLWGYNSMEDSIYSGIEGAKKLL